MSVQRNVSSLWTRWPRLIMFIKGNECWYVKNSIIPENSRILKCHLVFYGFCSFIRFFMCISPVVIILWYLVFPLQKKNHNWQLNITQPVWCTILTFNKRKAASVKQCAKWHFMSMYVNWLLRERKNCLNIFVECLKDTLVMHNWTLQSLETTNNPWVW